MKQKDQNTILSQPLPNSPEAERAVIGALLLEATAILEVDSILSTETFYNPIYGCIYKAISTIHERGDKIDMVSTMKELVSMGKLDEIGGPMVLSELASGMASSSNITEHAMY